MENKDLEIYNLKKLLLAEKQKVNIFMEKLRHINLDVNNFECNTEAEEILKNYIIEITEAGQKLKEDLLK